MKSAIRFGKYRARVFLLIGAIALLAQTVDARTIQFAGLNWTVKSGYGGPGPNYWSDSTDSVWVDGEGKLHLKIRQIGATWYCSEVIAQQSFGYARYTAKLSSNPELYEPNAVVGLFTYKNDTEEIDIEFTKWGSSSDPTTGQFAVQPSVPNTSSRVRFETGLAGTNPPSTHHFTWTPDDIYWQSYNGHADNLGDPGDLIYEHTYVGSKNPPLSDATFRINFWMFQGNTPTQEMELIVDDVQIVPESDCTVPADCDDGLFCNGVEDCVGGFCEDGTPPCTGVDQSCDEGTDSCVCSAAGPELADLSWFASCLDGPGLPVDDNCLCADRDGDGDTDLFDFASFQTDFVVADILFDFESGSQNWVSFGNGTVSSGLSAGSVGQGRFHKADFGDPAMTYGFGDRSANGVNMSAYTGMGIDARLTSYDPLDPFVGDPQIEFMLSIGYLEWASNLTLTDTFQTFAVDFADLVPQSSATQPVTQAQLSDPGLRIKLIMRKASNTGKVMLEYDQVTGRP